MIEVNGLNTLHKANGDTDDIINASLDVLRKKRIADNEIRSIAK